MEVLFADEQCWNLHDYTKHCAEVLHSGKLLFFYNDVAKRLGGSNLESAKRATLQHMRKVIKVCEDAVRSEFPSFGDMMAFRVFNLKEDVGCPTSSVLQDMIPGKKHYPETCDSLERLSLIFQVSRDKLIAEYEYLHRVASAHMKSAGVSNRESWQWAWRKCSNMQERHDNFGTCGLYACNFVLFFKQFHRKVNMKIDYS